MFDVCNININKLMFDLYVERANPRIFEGFLDPDRDRLIMKSKTNGNMQKEG
jgi:hypothetical protein